MNPELKTLGISDKAILAFFYPLIVALLGAAVNWISTGQFDGDTVKLAASGVILSGLSALGAYVGKPGTVAPADGTPTETVPEWAGSDSSLTPDTAPVPDQV